MNRKFNCLNIFSLILVITISSGISVIGQGLNFRVLETSEDWQAAKDDAKKSGKDIFLDIYATWCGPCKMMDSDVYTAPVVSGFFSANYINLKVDGESDLGTELATQYELSAYPSLYFIDADEELICRLVGYRNPEALIEAGKQVKESGKRYLQLNALYKSATLKDSQTDEFIALLSKFGHEGLLAEIAGEKIKDYKDADILNPSNKVILMAAGGSINSNQVKTILKNATTIKASWGKDDFEKYLLQVFNESMQAATYRADSALMEQIADELIPVFLMDDSARISETKLKTRKIYFAQLEDWDNYILAVENYYKNFENGNPKFLYTESYYIIENQLNNKILLDKCNEWLEKVIPVQPDFDTYFLAALVNTYREDSEATRKWMNKAESIAITDEQKASLDELKKYLESK
jgi:thiol-disulfide isomerase/thioredoxin